MFMLQNITGIFISLLTAFYSAFPGFPLFDSLRKYFPPEDGVEVYMLAPDPDSLMESFVIKTANNKIIVFDGGISNERTPYLPSAIRAVLGLGQNDYFEVEGWFLSHIHNDHYYELAKMLKGYNKKSNWKINNFYFSFPDIGVEWSSRNETDAEPECIQALCDGFDNYFRVNGMIDETVTDKKAAYNSVNGKFINDESVKDGLSVTIDSVKIDILNNWSKSDLIINSTSVVYRLTYNGHSILFLGDSYTDTEKKLLAAYDANDLKSDYVQLAHHGQNGCSKEFYDAIGAKDSIRLWASPQWLWKSGTDSIYQIPEVRTWMGLPAEVEDYVSGGFENSGKDFIAGMYGHYPKHPEKVSNWNLAVLDAQRVAVF